MEINIQNVSMTYPSGKQALQNLSLELRSPSLIGLLGPNGAGKSTLMKLLVAALLPTSGSILVDGQPLLKTERQLKAQLGYLPQDFGLFNELTVAQFLDYMAALKGLRDSGTAVREVIRTVNLEGQARARIRSLSGGQRQRVALARALVIEPKLLLLDEPLSNLDAKLRLSMRVEIKRLQKRLGITTLFVTHDQEECFSISDKVAVMNGGVIEQFDTPENIYKRPATEFVARFIGFENFLELAKKQDGVYTAPDGSEFLTSMDLDCEKFAGTIRPDDICLADDVQTENVLSGKIGVRTFLGKSYQYEVETSAGVLKVNMGTDHVYKEGEEIRLYLPKDKLILVRR